MVGFEIGTSVGRLMIGTCGTIGTIGGWICSIGWESIEPFLLRVRVRFSGIWTGGIVGEIDEVFWFNRCWSGVFMGE